MTGTDQHLFTQLYSNNPRNFSSSIALLEPDAINTKRPATLHHMPHNQVLHMVGSVPHHRTAVFKHAFNDICMSSKLFNSVNASLYPSSQLGINRARLISIENDVIDNRLKYFYELNNKLLVNKKYNKIELLEVNKISSIFSTTNY